MSFLLLAHNALGSQTAGSVSSLVACMRQLGFAHEWCRRMLVHIHESVTVHHASAGISNPIHTNMDVHAGFSNSILTNMNMHAGLSNPIQTNMNMHAGFSNPIHTDIIMHAGLSNPIHTHMNMHAGLSNHIHTNVSRPAGVTIASCLWMCRPFMRCITQMRMCCWERPPGLAKPSALSWLCSASSTTTLAKRSYTLLLSR